MKILIKSAYSITNMDDISNLQVSFDIALGSRWYCVEATTNGGGKFNIFKSKIWDDTAQVEDWFNWFYEEFDKIPKDSNKTHTLEYPKDRREKIINEFCEKQREKEMKKPKKKGFWG